MSCCGWLAMSRWLNESPWLGTIIIKKDVLYVFFCSIETSEISNGKQMKTAVGVYPLCIYTWHRCAPSSGGVRSMLSLYTLRRRHLLLLIFVPIGRPRTSIGKGNVSNRFPAPFLLIVTYKLTRCFCLGEWRKCQ